MEMVTVYVFKSMRKTIINTYTHNKQFYYQLNGSSESVYTSQAAGSNIHRQMSTESDSGT